MNNIININKININKNTNPFRKSFKLIELIDMIKSGEFVLPEIQREFVWDLDKIAELWDSIYRGYPIGQLLFWEAETSIPTYSFFDDNKKEDRFLFVAKRPNWAHTEKVESRKKTIVLDGQQRLTSLFLGSLETGVTVKARRNSNPVSERLCIYVGLEDAEGDNDVKLFDWKREGEDSGEYVSIAEALTSRRQHPNIRNLKEKLRSLENSVPVDYATGNDLGDVIEIFRRLNNNGKAMSKSELFLAMWFGSGKSRNLRRQLRELRGAFGRNFDVKDSTITQLLIFLFGTGGESSNKTTYSADMFSRITKDLPNLKESVVKTVKFLNEECGIYSNSEMISHSLFVPLVAVFFKFKAAPSEGLKKQLRCFVYRSLLFELFSKSTSSTLTQLKNSIENMIGDDFIGGLDKKIREQIFGDFENKKSQWLDGKINDLLEMEKGVKTNLALLLIRQEPANVSNYEMFDQDHIFAMDLFDPTTIGALNEDRRSKFGIRVDNEVREEWQLTKDELLKWKKISQKNFENRNKLPNLWLLEDSRNRQKGKKLVNIWYSEQNDEDKKVFWKEILLDEKDADYLKLTNFSAFYKEREEALFKEINRLLELPK